MKCQTKKIGGVELPGQCCPRIDRVRLNDVVPFVFTKEHMAGIRHSACVTRVCIVLSKRFMQDVLARAKSRLLHHIEHRSHDINHTNVPSLCALTSRDRRAASTLPDDEDILRVRMEHRTQTAQRTVHPQEGYP